MADRVTQIAREVLVVGGAPNARVTQIAREDLVVGGTPNARVTQIAREDLVVGGAPKARVTQIAREVLLKLTETSSLTIAEGLGVQFFESLGAGGAGSCVSTPTIYAQNFDDPLSDFSAWTQLGFSAPTLSAGGRHGSPYCMFNFFGFTNYCAPTGASAYSTLWVGIALNSQSYANSPLQLVKKQTSGVNDMRYVVGVGFLGDGRIYVYVDGDCGFAANFGSASDVSSYVWQLNGWHFMELHATVSPSYRLDPSDHNFILVKLVAGYEVWVENLQVLSGGVTSPERRYPIGSTPRPAYMWDGAAFGAPGGGGSALWDDLYIHVTRLGDGYPTTNNTNGLWRACVVDPIFTQGAIEVAVLPTDVSPVLTQGGIEVAVELAVEPLLTQGAIEVAVLLDNTSYIASRNAAWILG